MARRSRRAVALAMVTTLVAALAVVVLTVGEADAPPPSEESAATDVAEANDATDAGEVVCAPDPDPAVQVDRIDEAIGALEAETGAETGAAAEYFEINATADVVNLFVAGRADDGTGVVTPYAYAAGELRAEQTRAAEGISFTAAELVFDAQRVLSCVTAELAESNVVLFFAQGAETGAVKLSVLVESRQGGQLLVDVAPDGQVLAVDALDTLDGP